MSYGAGLFVASVDSTASAFVQRVLPLVCGLFCMPYPRTHEEFMTQECVPAMAQHGAKFGHYIILDNMTSSVHTASATSVIL